MTFIQVGSRNSQKLGRHAQIPQLLAYFEEDEEFYLVEEFIKGHCLKNELIIGKRFPDFTVVNLLKDILGILAFIHKQGVIHEISNLAILLDESKTVELF